MKEKKNIKNIEKIYLFMIIIIISLLIEIFLYTVYLNIQPTFNESLAIITNIILTFFMIIFGMIILLSVVGILFYTIENIFYISKNLMKK